MVDERGSRNNGEQAKLQKSARPPFTRQACPKRAGCDRLSPTDISRSGRLNKLRLTEHPGAQPLMQRSPICQNPRMPPPGCRLLPHTRPAPAQPAAMGVLVASIGCSWLVVDRLQQMHAAFETDARIVHRLLSQRVVQHDAIMATLALLQPAAAAAAADSLQCTASPCPRLRRCTRKSWPCCSARYSEVAARTAVRAGSGRATSRRTGHAAMAGLNSPAGRYYLVLAGTPASYALHIDLRTTIPPTSGPWTWPPAPVRVTLEHGGTAFVVQPGQVVQEQRHPHLRLSLTAGRAPASPGRGGPPQRGACNELPWWRMLGWCLLTAALWAAGRATVAPARGAPAGRRAAAWARWRG